MELTKCPVIFCGFDHTYYLEDKQLKGVTSLLRERGVAPDYSNIDEATLNKAAEYGTMVHRAIQNLCETGEDSDLAEVTAFKSFNLNVAANEYLVSDLDTVASSIDMVLEDCSLVDIKTTSVVHTDSVRWQLSIYKYLFEMQNPTLKVPHIYVLHLPKKQYGEPQLIELDVQPTDNVIALIKGETLPQQTTVDMVMAEQMKQISEYIRVSKACEEFAERIKEKVFLLMTEHNVTKWATSEGLTFSIVKGGERKTFDSTKFKKEHPEMAEDYMKVSVTKPSLRVTLK